MTVVTLSAPTVRRTAVRLRSSLMPIQVSSAKDVSVVNRLSAQGSTSFGLVHAQRFGLVDASPRQTFSPGQTTGGERPRIAWPRIVIA